MKFKGQENSKDEMRQNIKNVNEALRTLEKTIEAELKK